MNADESDEALCARMRRGDVAAFDALYARYERPLFAYLLALLRDRTEAEDALHEAFLGVLDAQRADFVRGSFRAFLFRVGRNLCLNRFRARDRQTRALSSLPVPAATPVPSDALLSREAAAALTCALDRLSDAHAEVCRLRATGMSLEEIADVLAVPLGTVKSRLHGALSSLREEMSSWAKS